MSKNYGILGRSWISSTGDFINPNSCGKVFCSWHLPEEHNIKRGEQIFVDVPFTSQEIDSINMEK